MYTMLTGFTVVFKTMDGEKIKYNYLWENEIIKRLKFWATCIDVASIDVINNGTGEVMYYCKPNELNKNEYICPDWQECFNLS